LFGIVLRLVSVHGRVGVDTSRWTIGARFRGDRLIAETFEPDNRGAEAAPVRHLRNNSKYSVTWRTLGQAENRRLDGLRTNHEPVRDPSGAGILDQIFEEEQFEGYRAVGECASESLFRPEIVGDTPPETVRAWFQKLADSLLPDNDAAFLPRNPGQATQTTETGVGCN
jgi:hypothetical protein